MIPYDKQLHLAVGFAIALITYVFLMLLRVDSVANLIVSVLLAAVAGYGKEEWDKRRPLTHTYDKKDFYFTCAGGLGGALSAHLINYFLKA